MSSKRRRCVKGEEEDRSRMTTPIYAPVAINTTANSPSPCPRPGKTYLIRYGVEKFLCISGGELMLVYENKRDDHLHGARWHCTDSSGWLNFQEAVSGNYLRYVHGRPLDVKSRTSGIRGWFQVLRYDSTENDDFYPAPPVNHLVAADLSFNSNPNVMMELKRIGLKDDKLVAVDSVDDAVAWDFIEVNE